MSSNLMKNGSGLIKIKMSLKEEKNEFKINIHKKSKEFDEISLLNKGSSLSIILEYEW